VPNTINVQYFLERQYQGPSRRDGPPPGDCVDLTGRFRDAIRSIRVGEGASCYFYMSVAFYFNRDTLTYWTVTAVTTVALEAPTSLKGLLLSFRVPWTIIPEAMFATTLLARVCRKQSVMSIALSFTKYARIGVYWVDMYLYEIWTCCNFLVDFVSPLWGTVLN
jgi:hypothetical protein